MIPKKIELQILEELEDFGKIKGVTVFIDESGEWAKIKPTEAINYVARQNLESKIINGTEYFKTSDLKDLFKRNGWTTLMIKRYSEKRSLSK